MNCTFQLDLVLSKKIIISMAVTQLSKPTKNLAHRVELSFSNRLLKFSGLNPPVINVQLKCQTCNGDNDFR